MSLKLCLIVCDSFLPEITEVIKSGNYSDVEIKAFHSSCIGAQLNPQKIQQIINQNVEHYSKVVLIGSSCSKSKPEEIAKPNNVEIYQLSQCFELLLNKSLIDYLINKKYYLVSNGWLINYKNHIREWGFEKETAKKYFRESIDKLILLETGRSEDYLIPLQALSEYMGLPFEILPVGLSHCRLLIDSIILKWREENERKLLNEKISNVTSQSADYILAFNELNNLVDHIEEKQIVDKIFNLLNMLFAPTNIIYIPNENGIHGELIFYKEEASQNEILSPNKIRLELLNNNDRLGTFEIFGVAFPNYIDRYKDVSRIVERIGGLAISNARKYNQIKSNEESLIKYSKELKEIIDSRDKFFSIIAHDLRGPFGGLLGLTELMATQRENFTMEEFIELSKALNVSAVNHYKLLNNLLDWALLQQRAAYVSLDKHNLFSLAVQSIDTLNEQASQKSISISNEIDGSLIVECDEKMISSVLRNLLSNAIKFTRKNGSVTINASQIENNMIQVSVRDTGVGISEKDLNRLFTLGEKVSSKGTESEPSTGLGLILCKEFIEKHGGKIWVTSQLGIGTTFHFTLPRVDIL